MKLISRPASPYGRKALLIIHERGLQNLVDVQMLSQEETAQLLPDFNPLVKVPAFVTDDGTVLYDSPVICEYLDSQHNGEKFFPTGGIERWPVLRLQALGDGIADAIVAYAVEGAKPEDKQMGGWFERQIAKVNNGLDYLEKNMSELSGSLNIGQLAVVCAVGYWDFRCDDPVWRNGRPQFSAWVDEIRARPSMQATHFKRPDGAPGIQVHAI